VSGFVAGFDASFAAIEKGRPVLASTIAVLGRAIASIGNARSSFGKGIDTSCRAFAALTEAVQGKAAGA
jgi:hypothetical protein